MNAPREPGAGPSVERPGPAASGEHSDEAAMQAYLTRSATADSAQVRQFLVQAIQNPQESLQRLARFETRLAESNRLDEKSRKIISDLRGQLERMLAPPSDAGGENDFDVPIQFRRGALINNQKASVDSAVQMIAAVAQELGVDDLSGTSILDIGCGVKFTQAFYGRKIPVKRYHGVDVDPAMIEFLSSNVKDDRLSYKHIDIYNARYHRAGRPLSAETDIGVGDEKFDFICLFSVFTHLAPPDYRAMLELTRRYILPTGTFLFTTFIDESIPEFFKDSNPEKPLLMALYKESAVREFAAAAGWSVERIFFKRQQYWVICKPI